MFNPRFNLKTPHTQAQSSNASAPPQTQPIINPFLVNSSEWSGPQNILQTDVFQWDASQNPAIQTNPSQEARSHVRQEDHPSSSNLEVPPAKKARQEHPSFSFPVQPIFFETVETSPDFFQDIRHLSSRPKAPEKTEADKKAEDDFVRDLFIDVDMLPAIPPPSKPDKGKNRVTASILSEHSLSSTGRSEPASCIKPVQADHRAMPDAPWQSDHNDSIDDVPAVSLNPFYVQDKNIASKNKAIAVDDRIPESQTLFMNSNTKQTPLVSSFNPFAFMHPQGALEIEKKNQIALPHLPPVASSHHDKGKAKALDQNPNSIKSAFAPPLPAQINPPYTSLFATPKFPAIRDAFGPSIPTGINPPYTLRFSTPEFPAIRDASGPSNSGLAGLARTNNIYTLAEKKQFTDFYLKNIHQGGHSELVSRFSAQHFRIPRETARNWLQLAGILPLSEEQQKFNAALANFLRTEPNPTKESKNEFVNQYKQTTPLNRVTLLKWIRFYFAKQKAEQLLSRPHDI